MKLSSFTLKNSGVMNTGRAMWGTPPFVTEKKNTSVLDSIYVLINMFTKGCVWVWFWDSVANCQRLDHRMRG